MVKDQRKLDISKLPAAKLNKILAEDSAAAPAIGGVVPIFLLGIFLAATMALPVYIFSGAMFDLSLEEVRAGAQRSRQQPAQTHCAPLAPLAMSGVCYPDHRTSSCMSWELW